MTITPAAGTILVRHAATAWTGVRWCGRADPPLTAAGERAAADLASRLAAEIGVGAIVVSSPARRTRATAEAIGRATGAPIRVLDTLLEVDVGRVEGLTWGELSTADAGLADAIATGRAVDWPGGESAADVAARARRATTELAALRGHGDLIVVSHGAFLHAIARALGHEAAALEPCGTFRIPGTVP